MSSSAHIGSRKKDISILGIGPTQKLDDTKLTAEVHYSINFSMQATVFYLLMLQKYINSKQKIMKQKKSFVFRKYFQEIFQPIT